MTADFLDLVSDDKNLTFETARLLLDPVVEHHAASMLPLLLDEPLYEFVPQNPPTLESLQKTYKIWSERKSPDGSEIWLNWIARNRLTGECMGHFQSGFDEKNGFSVAYTLGKRHQKQGYATEGLDGIVRFLRAKMNTKNIKAWVDTRNEASIRLLK